jgi:hypothetical protein
MSADYEIALARPEDIPGIKIPLNPPLTKEECYLKHPKTPLFEKGARGDLFNGLLTHPT